MYACSLRVYRCEHAGNASAGVHARNCRQVLMGGHVCASKCVCKCQPACMCQWGAYQWESMCLPAVSCLACLFVYGGDVCMCLHNKTHISKNGHEDVSVPVEMHVCASPHACVCNTCICKDTWRHVHATVERHMFICGDTCKCVWVQENVCMLVPNDVSVCAWVYCMHVYWKASVHACF